MAKRMTKAEFQVIILLLVIGLPIYGAYKFAEAIGWIWFVLTIILVGSGFIWFYSQHKKMHQAELAKQKQLRRTELLQKYSDEKVVEAIINRSFWQGQTAEQLRDSLGNPIDIDEKVLKTKKKEIWKYNYMGRNRFRLRIILENDQVVGWDEKM